MNDGEGHISKNQDPLADFLSGAVRSNRVFLAAVVIPLCLLALMVAAYFAPDWSAPAKGSTLALFLVFLLFGLLEVLLIPSFFIGYAVKGYLSSDPAIDSEHSTTRFANLYAVAVLGGTTPCVLGLVLFFFSRNLWEGLALFALGLASVALCSIWMKPIIARHLDAGGNIFHLIIERRGKGEVYSPEGEGGG